MSATYKRLLFLLLMLISNAVATQAQTAPPSLEPGPYEGIITDSLSKAELYKRSKQWVISTFKSYDNNINLNDEGMDIVASTPVLNLEKRNVLMLYTLTNKCTFKLTILFKEGRIKYLFDNFSHQYVLMDGANNSPMVYDGSFLKSKLYKQKREKMQSEIDALIKGYIVSLTQAIRIDKTKTDW